MNLDGHPIKPVSHRTRLGTRFQYGILGYTVLTGTRIELQPCLGMSWSILTRM